MEFKETNVFAIKANPFQSIGQDWMLITARKDGKVNTMTASWGGLGVLWAMNVAYIVLRPHRYTKEFVDSSDYFSLSFFDGKYKQEMEYLGTISGRNENKIGKSGLTINNMEPAPYFQEASQVLICKKLFHQDFKEECFLDKRIIDEAYPERDFHTLYVGKIEKVLARP